MDSQNKERAHIFVHGARQTEMEERPHCNFVDADSTPLFTAS
jgi:hypothetical protein